MKKLIKFDVIHPGEYLVEKKKSWSDLHSISRQEYCRTTDSVAK